MLVAVPHQTLVRRLPHCLLRAKLQDSALVLRSPGKKTTMALVGNPHLGQSQESLVSVVRLAWGCVRIGEPDNCDCEQA